MQYSVVCKTLAERSVTSYMCQGKDVAIVWVTSVRRWSRTSEYDVRYRSLH